MKKCKILASLFFILLFVTSVQAQLFSISGQLGYARPQGSVFKDKVTGEKLGSLGIGYDFDVLMGLDRFDNKLSVGIMYDGNALFGFESSTEFNFGMYGLAMYGVKGHYRLLSPDRKVSPYASLGLGLSQFGTPDVYSGDSLVVSGKSIYSLAVRPEIGFDLGGLQLSVAYFVPMHYKVESATGNFSGTAGVLSFSLGWRQYISFGGSSIKTKEGKKNVAQSLKSKALGKIGVSINDNSDNVEITQDEEKTSAANNNATKKTKKVENANAKSSAERKENVSKDEVDVSEETIVETATPVSTQSQKTETQEYSTTSVSVQGKTLTPQRIPQTNAEAVRPSASSSDEHVTFSNPNFKVGETVFYKMRDRMYSAKIISFKGSNIAVVEMENGATVERYLKDLVKAK